jgi:hypothetical protein
LGTACNNAVAQLRNRNTMPAATTSHRDSASHLYGSLGAAAVMWGDMDSLTWIGAGMAAAAVIALNWKALPFAFHLRCLWRIAASLWKGKLATIDEVRAIFSRIEEAVHM